MEHVALPPATGVLARALAALDTLLRAAIVASMSGMVAVVSAQVLLRYVFNESLDWGEEVARLLFVWTIFLAIPLGVKEGAHIGIELVVTRFAPAVQRALGRVMASLVIVLMGVVAWRSTTLAAEQWDELLPTLSASVGWFIVPVALGAALSILHLLPQAVHGTAARGAEVAE
jgi:TRAP-type C4-dicarboxylate transport system permease small subunit